jgi:predicted transcriptional regulator
VRKNEPSWYRSKIRIFFDILKVVHEDPEVKITHMIHEANLPYERLNSYLDQMQERGLILVEQQGDNPKFSITRKGARFLSEFHHMEGWVNAFGLDL